MLAGVKSNPSKSSTRPSSIIVFPPTTLSTVTLTTVDPSVDVNVPVSPAAIVPVIPVSSSLVLPSPNLPTVPAIPSIPTLAK